MLQITAAGSNVSLVLYFGTIGILALLIGLVFYIILHQRMTIRKIARQLNVAIQGPGKNYIIMDIEEKYRGIFYDAFKVFEDYSKLNGHRIKFSIDNSIDKKLAYKITFDERDGFNEEDIRADIKNLIARINNGEPLDNLPIILPVIEHNLVLSAIKNRLSLLEHNYNLQKNTTEYYKKILDSFFSTNNLLQPTYNIYVAGSGSITNENFHADNKSNIFSDSDKNDIVNDQSTSLIKISHSFNQRKEQIEKINSILEMVQNENMELKEKVLLLTSLENIKEEIKEAQEPDVKKISKWLKNLKNGVEKFVFVHETVEAIHWLLKSFGID